MSPWYYPKYHEEYLDWKSDQRARNRESSDGEYMEQQRRRHAEIERQEREDRLNAGGCGTIPQEDLDEMREARERSREREKERRRKEKKERDRKQYAYYESSDGQSALQKVRKCKESRGYEADYSENEAGKTMERKRFERQNQEKKDRRRQLREMEEEVQKQMDDDYQTRRKLARERKQRDRENEGQLN